MESRTLDQISSLYLLIFIFIAPVIILSLKLKWHTTLLSITIGALIFLRLEYSTVYCNFSGIHYVFNYEATQIYNKHIWLMDWCQFSGIIFIAFLGYLLIRMISKLLVSISKDCFRYLWTKV